MWTCPTSRSSSVWPHSALLCPRCSSSPGGACVGRVPAHTSQLHRLFRLCLGNNISPGPHSQVLLPACAQQLCCAKTQKGQRGLQKIPVRYLQRFPQLINLFHHARFKVHKIKKKYTLKSHHKPKYKSLTISRSRFA